MEMGNDLVDFFSDLIVEWDQCFMEWIENIKMFDVWCRCIGQLVSIIVVSWCSCWCISGVCGLCGIVCCWCGILWIILISYYLFFYDLKCVVVFFLK